MNDILTTNESGVLIVTFNRPEKKNSLTGAMYEMLASTLGEAASDGQIRAVVLTGNEQMFSAGYDVGEFVKNPPVTGDAPVWQFLRALNEFPKPVIGAVCGIAVGIGVTMLLHCDLIFAGDNAKFSLPFVSLGVCPEAASSLLLPRLAGYQRAARMLLTGDPFDARSAQEVGLVNQILPATETYAFALSEAKKLVAKPLSAIVETKRLMKMSERAAVEARMTEEIAVFDRMVTGGAAKEAFAAFGEKRKPDFSQF
ncbi:enoyl-CoA hydratase [Paraburkholderia sp. GAS334]|uniref:enoyl-CoA hydratase n=1 Tax=Paraburkholderia sp. GAS334 TaxID=3035131 RepID=UPI003D19FD8C